MQQETAAQILYRTAMRFEKIADLPVEQCRTLMAMPEDEFKVELSRIRQQQEIHTTIETVKKQIKRAKRSPKLPH
jgi:hypothetical protein